MYPRVGRRKKAESESEEEEEEEDTPRLKSGMPRPAGSSRRKKSSGMPKPEASPAPIGFGGLDDSGEEESDPGPDIGFDALEKELLERPYPKEVYKIQRRRPKSRSPRSKPPTSDEDEDEEDEEEEEESEKQAEPVEETPSKKRRSKGGKRSKRQDPPSTSSKGSKSSKKGKKRSSKKSKPRRSKKAPKTESKTETKPEEEVHVAVRQGTMGDAPGFSAERDADTLRKAMRGVGCDAKTVSAVLCTRSNRQRQELKKQYTQQFGRYLEKDIVDELHGHHEDVAVALLRTPAEFDAAEVRRAVAGAGTNEGILIEILASRSNAEMKAMKEAYRKLYKNRDLVKDIESDTSFHFKKLMRALCQGTRDESGRVDRAKAAVDAAELYKAGEKRLGTDESKFNAVLASQGFPQIQAVFEEYSKVSKNDLEKAIRKEFSGSVMNGLLSVVKCARHMPSYFAERLYLSMKGAGTKDRNLVRLVVSRSEIDMVQIKEAFQARFGKSLESWIKGDTSGKYRDALLLLVNGNKA